MQKNTQTHFPLSTREGVLISRQQMYQQKRADNILSAAKDVAKKMYLQAEQDIALHQQQAYQYGYQQGMLQAVQQVVNYMNDSQALGRKLQKELHQQATDMLSHALNHSAILVTLLDEWLHTLDQQADECILHVLLPKSDQDKIKDKELRAYLEKNWHLPIQIEYHADQRFMIKYADQVAEFSPDSFISQAAERLVRPNKVLQATAQLSLDGVEQLRKIFADVLPEEGSDEQNSYPNSEPADVIEEDDD